MVKEAFVGKQFRPPPNPAKLTDSRARDYIKLYGRKSQELDAMDPRYLKELAEDYIKDSIDWSAWEVARDLEDEMKAALIDAADTIKRW